MSDQLRLTLVLASFAFALVSLGFGVASLLKSRDARRRLEEWTKS